MARSALSKTSLARNLVGSVLTDETFTELATGTGNGVYFPLLGTDLIVLKNDTGDVATFTIVVTTPAGYTTFGITVPSPTIEVADGKTVVLRVADVLKDGDGNVQVDCDVAGEMLVYDLRG